MKPTTLLLLVLGVLLGPAYFAYCEYLSGRPAGTFTFTDRSDRWVLPDGGILRFRNGMGYKPQAAELLPEKNLYRFRLIFSVEGAASASASNEYQFSVLQADTGILQRNFRIEGTGTQSHALGPIEIIYPGSYTLLIEEIGKPPLTVSRVTLEVQSGVEKPHMWLAWSGLVLLVFGAGIVIRDFLVQGGQRPPRLRR